MISLNQVGLLAALPRSPSKYHSTISITQRWGPRAGDMPHIVCPALSAMDRVIVTPPGQTPPTLGENLPVPTPPAGLEPPPPTTTLNASWPPACSGIPEAHGWWVGVSDPPQPGLPAFPGSPI